jgi:hypothetical protein
MSTSIEHDTMVGGWHYLCVGVLNQAVNRLANGRQLWGGRFIASRIESGGGADKEIGRQREVAREWIKGGVGLVTFEDCCEALGVDPARARSMILIHCRDRRGKKPDLEEVG